jgi:hypothetical protein
MPRFRMPLPPPLPGAYREPFRRAVDVRETLCVYCGAVCRFDSITSPHPEAPEYLRAHGAWFGFVKDEAQDGTPLGTVSIIAVCSEKCVQQLLEE